MSVQHSEPQDERATPATFIDMVRRLDWRYELLTFLLILAESTLVYIFLGTVMSAADAGRSVLPFLLVVGVMLFAHYLPHLLDEWRVWSPTYELLIGSGIVVSLLVVLKLASFPDYALFSVDWLREAVRGFAMLEHDALRPVWGVLALLVYAWWRGRSRDESSIDSAYTMLRAGLAVAIVLVVIALLAASEGEQVRERLSLAVIGFFVFTLLSIGVARMNLEGFRTSAPLGPRWLATFIAPVAVVVLVAIIGAGIFSHQFLETVLWLLTPVFFVLNIVFQVFVFVLAVLAFIILTPIVWLIGNRELEIIQATQTPTEMEGDPANESIAQTAMQVPEPLRYLIAALILLVIVWLLTKFLFRRRRKRRDVIEEERESVLEWDDLFGSLKKNIAGLFRRSTPDDPLAHLRNDERWRYTLQIREIYVKLQERGATAGRPRREPETADEYRPGVGPVIQLPQAVDEITEIYRRTRYSDVPATADDAARAQAAWQIVEQAG